MVRNPKDPTTRDFATNVSPISVGCLLVSESDRNSRSVMTRGEMESQETLPSPRMTHPQPELLKLLSPIV